MEEYSRLAAQAAMAMKLVDPAIELVSCGSSGLNIPTFPQWEAVTLDHTYDYVDYGSMHQYYGNSDGDTQDFLACSDDMDRFIRSVIATCDYVQAKHRGSKKINISFDEWNVWFHSRAEEDTHMRKKPWQVGPPLLEDIYTFEDALLVGGMLITLLRHADRVKIACLAQLVNVIAPIMTERNGGSAWRQTIYWPFQLTSRYGRGTSLLPVVDSPKVETSRHGAVDAVIAAAVENDDGTLTVFAANRDLSRDIPLTMRLRGFEAYRTAECTALQDSDLKAVNSAEAQNVRPVARAGVNPDNGGTLELLLHKASWNVIRLQK